MTNKQAICIDREREFHVEELLLVLLEQSDRRFNSVFELIDEAHSWFGQLDYQTTNLQRTAKKLRFIRMAGVTESASLPSTHAFVGLFDEV